MSSPFDAVLLIAFGGPMGRADIRPFLANVLRGRRVSPERVEEVAHHYELFDGVSPITELTLQQAQGLRNALAARGHLLPVYVGMRNWNPYLRDTLAQMSRDGVRRAVGVIAAAHRSYSGCTQYKENVADARRALREAGLADVQVTYVSDWHLSPGFIDANADHVAAAVQKLPPDVCRDSELVFTAHSIPESMAQEYPYQLQLEASCLAVAQEIARRASAAQLAAWRLVFQSRSGRPEDPWLEPDVCDYLREAPGHGAHGVVLCPIGFVCDHIEVLYDLDTEAAEVAATLELPFARASAVNDHPRFVDALTDAVLETVTRYARGRSLPIVPAAP
ncbi:MAG: ferrochelatase [Acidobacteriota bacterium]|nr:ferrochelatase [Acidobacteriota bacterium]MDQ3417897.1 ferrochelatase [Acidobacteriota bacterium]